MTVRNAGSVLAFAGWVAFHLVVPGPLAGQDESSPPEYDANGEATVPVPCPLAWGRSFRFNVPKFMAAGTVPFYPHSYLIQNGRYYIGTAWYWPDPTTTRYRELDWEWQDEGVFVRCYEKRYLWGALVIGYWDPQPGVRGTAVVIAPEPIPGGGGGGGGDDDPGGDSGDACADLKLPPGSGCWDVYVDGVRTGTICC